MSPALGRILPMPQPGQAGAAGGHPAYFRGLAVIIVSQFMIPPLAFTPIVLEWTTRLGGG